MESEECDAFPVPEDKTLFVTRVLADFDMPDRTDIAGALEIGQPVSAIRICFVSTGGLVAESNVLGYVLP